MELLFQFFPFLTFLSHLSFSEKLKKAPESYLVLSAALGPLTMTSNLSDFMIFHTFHRITRLPGRSMVAVGPGLARVEELKTLKAAGSNKWFRGFLIRTLQYQLTFAYNCHLREI